MAKAPHEILAETQSADRKELMHLVGQIVAGGGHIDAFDTVYKARKIIVEVDLLLAKEQAERTAKLMQAEQGVNLPVEAGK